MKAIYYNIFGLGHINPTLPLVKQLVESGVQVIYHTSPERQELIASTGAEFRDYGRPDYKASDYNPGTNFVLQTIPASLGLLPHLLTEIELEKPDFLLYDSMAPWGKLLGIITGLPSFCTVSTFALSERLRLETFAKHQVELDDANRKAMALIAEKWRTDFPLTNALGAYNDCNFVFTSRALNPPLEELPQEHFHFVGSMPARHTTDFPFEKLQRHPRKLITMALGTLLPQEDPQVLAWYRHLIRAFGFDRRFWLALGVGSEKNLAALGTLPVNVIAQARIPQQELLDQSSLFIHHAGMNSVSEGLSRGVPMIVIPHSKDQFVNARRVVEMGAGLCLDRDQLSAQALKRAALQLMFSPSVQHRAREIQAQFRQDLGVKGMLDIIRERVSA